MKPTFFEVDPGPSIRSGVESSVVTMMALFGEHFLPPVLRHHLEHVGAKLTKLRQDQADYIGVPVEGPYKPDHYRY